MKKKIGTLVFDLDGTLETPYFDKEDSSKVRTWMKTHSCGNTFNRMYTEVLDSLPHFFLTGAFELLQWAVDQGFKIVFFSNAIEERNKELCPILMERAFRKSKIPPYRIFSRGDCVDTRRFDAEKQKLYQGLWHGNYKKKLAGIVVKESELPNTLMIEDDNSYAAKGEERNFVYGVYGGVAHSFFNSFDLAGSYAQSFHLPFYFCGILNRIVTYAKRAKVSLAEAAVKVQYVDFGHFFPQDGNPIDDWKGFQIRTPYPPQEEYRIFVEGLEALRKYNPKLAFWGEIDETAMQWPTHDDPKPVRIKPEVKTDMTRLEAKYLLGALREILCMALDTNVKHVKLISRKKFASITSSGLDSFSWREKNFDDEEYFDSKAVVSVSLYGYLPVCKNLPKQDMCSETYQEDSGTIKYKTCLRIIKRFFWTCFKIDVDCDAVKIINVELWKISVIPNSNSKKKGRSSKPL